MARKRTAKARCIGATIGVIAAVVGYVETSLGICSTVWRWVRRIWHKEPPQRWLYLWTVGNDERPAGPAEIEALEAALEKMGSEESSLVTHHAVNLQLVPVHQSPAWLWRVGSDERPASMAEIAHVMGLIKAAADDESVNAIVTRHNVTAMPVSANAFKVAKVDKDGPAIEQIKALLSGLE